jgi:hypothetical protein
MEQPNPPVHKPSIAWSAILGALVGLFIGGGIAFVLAIRNGEYHEGAGFKLSACLGAVGALLGFDVAVWRRKALGGGTRKEEWDKFIRSPALWLVLMTVLLGSLGLALVSGHLFDAVGRSIP